MLTADTIKPKQEKNISNLKDYILLIVFQVNNTMYYFMFGVAWLVLQSESGWINGILQHV